MYLKTINSKFVLLSTFGSKQYFNNLILKNKQNQKSKDLFKILTKKQKEMFIKNYFDKIFYDNDIIKKIKKIRSIPSSGLMIFTEDEVLQAKNNPNIVKGMLICHLKTLLGYNIGKISLKIEKNYNEKGLKKSLQQIDITKLPKDFVSFLKNDKRVQGFMVNAANIKATSGFIVQQSQEQTGQKDSKTNIKDLSQQYFNILYDLLCDKNLKELNVSIYKIVETDLEFTKNYTEEMDKILDEIAKDLTPGEIEQLFLRSPFISRDFIETISLRMIRTIGLKEKLKKEILENYQYFILNNPWIQ